MIQWKPFSPKALDFIQNSDARLNILDGSVRSSKTVNCTVRWLTYLLDGPPGDLVMCGKTIATLQRNVLNDIFDILGPKNARWTNRQQGELRLLHRRVYCIGANNEDAESKIRGATLAGAYCDEANLYPQSFFAQLMARLSIAGAKCFCNCNPDSPYHWFYTDYIMNEEITNKKRWRFTMDDNLSLDPEYVASLKQMYTGVFYKRFIEGEWCAADGLIYDMYDPELHVRYLDLNLPENRPSVYYIGCDYGTSTVMSWSAIAAIPGKGFYKFKEFYYDARKKGNQKTDREFADLFDSFVESIPYINTTLLHIYCDPSAASWKAELRFRGYIVLDADNDVINGIREVGSLLKSSNYFIDPSCEYTQKEYESYVWDEKAQRLGVDKPLKVFDHACDSDRYVLYTISKNRASGVY